MMMGNGRDEEASSSSSPSPSCESNGGGGGNQVVGRRMGLLATASTLKDVDETEEETEEGDDDRDSQAKRQPPHQHLGTCRHLKGPLADSPDEGYVGDSGHDGNGSSD